MVEHDSRARLGIAGADFKTPSGQDRRKKVPPETNRPGRSRGDSEDVRLGAYLISGR
jgi:hypothetical protein